MWSVPLCFLDGFGPTVWIPFAFEVAGLQVNPTSPGSSQTLSCLPPLGKTAAPASLASSSHPGPALFLEDFKIHQPGLSAPSPLRGLHPVPLQLLAPWPPPGPHRPRELASASCPLGAQSVTSRTTVLGLFLKLWLLLPLLGGPLFSPGLSLWPSF